MKAQRIEKNEALKLLKSENLIGIGMLAEEYKKVFHPENSPVTFVIDSNVNYTNICSCRCSFCAFHKKKTDKNAYTLEYRQIKPKIQDMVNANGTQLLMQGGLNPDIPLEYYIELISSITNDFPNVDIHSFSPAEISFIARNNKMTSKELIKLFLKCGLSSIPGGGAEILSDEIRQKISPKKISSQEWIDIMQTAQKLGLKTTATMVFGFGENYSHIVEHLWKIRDLQDKTGGFKAFIPWSYCGSEGKQKKSTAYEYLKILSVSRIVLDNIPNIQVSWVTQGLKTAQLALKFGANDFGGVMLEENVVRAAGVSNKSTVEEIIQTIEKAGFKAAQRNTAYNILREF